MSRKRRMLLGWCAAALAAAVAAAAYGGPAAGKKVSYAHDQIQILKTGGCPMTTPELSALFELTLNIHHGPDAPTPRELKQARELKVSMLSGQRAYGCDVLDI